jgi:DNA-binding CsgD family transcriptional regulator/pimeloyl-ACP methyl ester carboxylesterase
MEPPSVQYTTTPDGFNIAFGVSGTGTPLVFLPLTFSHVQLAWSEGTVLSQWLQGLAERFRLVQYDGRGQGLSTRGLPRRHNSSHELLDLEAVIARLDLDRVVLMARGPLAHAALRYAHAHPERVLALLLFSAPAGGSSWPASFAQRLAADHWDLFLQSFTAFDGRPADPELAVRRMRQTVTQDDWGRLIDNWIASDIRPLLKDIATPALVIHPRDVIQPLPGATMAIAAGLPNSRYLATDGASQLGNPIQGLRAIDQFLESLPDMSRVDSAEATEALQKLSVREGQVLRLIAAGKSNQQIATDLVISVNTVLRHVSNILAKTGAANRTEAAALTRRGEHGR